MSGIYINGMEMPKSCYHCVWMFRDKPNGKVYCTATEADSDIFAADQWFDVSDVLAENRHPNCPLVPVPDHGRLGDLDALEQMFADIDNAPYSGFDGEEPFYSADDAAQIIRLAPTIIPADHFGEATKLVEEDGHES